MNTTIKGLILDATTKKGISNLTIEAWEQDVKVSDLIGKEVTDSNGNFSFTFDESYWKDNARDQNPVVFFRVYDASGNLLRDTQHQIYWTEEQQENPIAIAIGEASKLVYGKVLLETGKAAANLVVRVYQKSLKIDRIIAASTTDNTGDYSISYPAEGVDNIIVRVFNPKGDNAIAASPIIFNAKEKEEVNLTVTAEVYQSASLYETIEQSIATLLGELDVQTLDPDQIKLLANESGIEQKELLIYQNAQTLSTGHHLSAEVFFAILQNGMETSEEKLFAVSEEQLKHILAKSWDEHLISTARSAEILNEISAHEKLSIHYQLLHTSFSSKTNLLQTWSTLKLSATQLGSIGAALKAAGSNSIDFWNAIKQDKTLKPLIPKLELLTALTNVTFGNLTLINKISENEVVHSLADLAGWSHSEWVKTIGTSTIPDEITGKPDERIHRYATSMKRMVDYLYPTQNVLVSYVNDETNNSIIKADYTLFHQNNPDFLFENHNLENYLKKYPNALIDLQNIEAFKQDLEITTRLFRLSPSIDRYESIAHLKTMGISNSHGITQKGFSSFQSEYTALGGDQDEAQHIYRNAQHVSALVNTLMVRFMSDQDIQMYVYNNNIKLDATWKTFFGSEDYCGCQHCKSVYSPAAYLADSLHFLENRKQTNGTTFYTVLDARRPDIKHILLNCENANTPMPYIDLVNEVLEVAVIDEGPTEFDFSGYQSTRTMEELMANPERLQEEAYTKLKEAIYPWSMPFDLYNELGKTYLQHLGVRHHKLVSLFPFAETTLAPHPTAEEILIFKEKRNIKAVLNLNDIDWDILMGTHYNTLEAHLWGTLDRISTLVSDTLEKTQLSLDDLKILIDCKFVNPDGKLEIDYADLCSIEGATLKNYTRTMRKHMLQMVRLQRKLKTDLRTTDHILNALNATEIDAFVLNNIAQLVRWQETHNLPFTELVTWAGNMPTANRKDDENHRELYEQIFLSYLEGNNDTTRDLFTLSEDKKSLHNETPSLDGGNYSPAIRNYISGALNISSADLDLIISALPTNKLSLKNLSIIYGTLSLARTLHLSISDTIGLRKIINTSTTDRINEFLAISEARTELQKSAFSVAKMLYLCGLSEEGKVTSKRKIEILQEIREGLWKLNNQGIEPDSSNILPTPLTLEAFIFEKLGGTFGIDRNIISLLLNFPENSDSYLVYPAQNGPKSYLKFFLNPNTFLSQHAAPLVEVGMFPELEELCELLNKISLLYKSLKFDTEHYQSLLTDIGKNKWFDFNHLGSTLVYPSFSELLHLNEIVDQTGNSEINLFDLLQSSAINDTWKKDTAALLGYKDGATLGETMKALGIDEHTEAIQHTSCYLNLLSAKALETYLGVQIAEYTDGTGQFVLAQSELDQDRVMKIIQVAKSKYGEDKWQNVTKQLRDAIREEQRDALLTYLMATKKDSFQKPLNTPEKLYAHFLLDTEMSACTVTSRIRLALSSVQLFAQRCLMNLEPQASLQGISDDEQEEWKEWTWRKNYRVWEANRKVFLYPENWLEPEWRDDKTPFFKELESELQQNELTSENAESAYLNYLYKLESVSNLEILALCEAEKVDDILSGYYIFGRTHGTPKTLYFRKYLLEPESFTPWEKVEVDFEGDELVPVVHSNRLYLFWPIFSEQSIDQPRIGDGEHGYNDPTKYWEINVAWSEYKNGNWSSKLQSSMTNCYSFGKNPVLLYHYIDNDKFQLELFINKGNKNTAYDELSYEKVGDFIRSGKTFLFDAYYPYQPSLDAILNGASPETTKKIKRVLTLKDILNNETVVPEKHRIIVPSNNKLSSYLIQSDTKSAIVYNKESIKHLLLLNYPVISEIINKTIRSGLGKILNENNELNNAYLNNFSSWPFDFYNVETLFFSYNVQNSFSQYNWELFFHIPVHVANKLRQDQKFEEAQKWFHYVFDPTSSEATNTPKKFWVFQPFRDYVCSGEDGTPCNIQELMRILNEESTIHEDANHSEFQTFEQSVHAWERNPFSPHTVARTRIIAYMKWVVMRYIDNLIEWADQLFRRDSIESLNEATQLYMLAWNILGEEPHSMNAKERGDQSYNQLRGKLDEFSNALVELENRISQQQTTSNHSLNIFDTTINSPRSGSTDLELKKPKTPKVINQGQDEILPANTLYFCIPQNEKLLGYWDLVRDRFFKLRNCLNIEGIYRQLPLYEPPIDPALLIKAKAAGLSIADALSADYNPTSHYRFLVLLQKAIDYANDVRAFGGALLSALEKRDAEQMVALRSMHEVQLLNEVTLVRKEQINELKLSNQSLDYSMANIENRRAYYAEKEFMSKEEKEQQNLLIMANGLQIISQSYSMLAAAIRPIPDITAGYSGLGGYFVTNVGGEKSAAAVDFMAQAYSMASGIVHMEASSTGQTANYKRRSEDWKFQESTAEIELKQLEKQILAAQIRMSIAQQELKNHELQVENSTKQLELVQAKFTNFELYDWMVGQLKTLYFQSYQMAFDMAKKAESALAFEHGIGTDSSEVFIKFGYWDNLKEGLLSGEKLHHDLKRMEMIYMQRNKRLHEVSKTVSLAMLDAEELGRLRTVGTCDISIPEILFDLDFPQHTDRKIKSVSITIPAITGPYTGINAVLSTTKFGSVAVTGSQNDAGLFQFNFNDERYLPFEGMRFEPVEALDRTISFNLQMNSEFRTFDYNTITDVLVHIHYTADTIQTVQELEEKKSIIELGLKDVVFTKLISIKNEFSQDWFEAKSSNSTSLTFDLNKVSLPYFSKGKSLNTLVQCALMDESGKLPTKTEGTKEVIDWEDPSNPSPNVYQITFEDIEKTSDAIVVIKYTLPTI